MKKLLHRAWAEINLDALDANVEAIRAAAPGKTIMAVVKANAYGHGIKIAAPELFRIGVKYFAVSCMAEALELREILPEAEILIFGYCDGEQFSELIAHDLIQTVGETGFAKSLSDYALKNGVKIRVHVKANTGMTRIGIDTPEELSEILALSGLSVEGVYTHFACADSTDPDDDEYTRGQQEKLNEIGEKAKKAGIPVYSQNSGGILYHSNFDGEIVRSGIITYGCMPNTAEKLPIPLTPVMRLRARVCQLKDIPAGVPVSYGRTFVSEAPMRLAVIPIGYADGYSRSLSGKGAVYVNGQRCPICGRICMDQTIVDVTGKDVSVGDIAEIYSDSIPEIMVDNIADSLGTIGYELLCRVSARIPRVGVRNGEPIE